MSRLRHQTPTYSDSMGKFGLAYHMEMVIDSERVNLCKSGIERTLESHHVFCELGCGTGIFTIHAAKRCRKVYAIEVDPGILNIAKSNVAKAGLEDRVEFIQGDAMEIQLDEQADVIFCDMMSIWLINEPQVPVINYAREHYLKDDGVVIPSKVINLVELGNFDYIVESTEMKASLPQFTGIRPPRIMTESKVVSIIDFNQSVELEIHSSMEINILLPGVINCARLSSIVQFAHGVNFYSTDSLMPVTIVPLEKEVSVSGGENVLFTAHYRHRSNLDGSLFKVEKRIRG